MKKVFLLFTILLCAGQLYGMQIYTMKNYHNGSPLENLSVAAKAALDSAFATGDLNTVIETIKKISDTNDKLYNIVMFNIIYVPKYQKSFNSLVHILAKEFKLPALFIAQKFKTPTAKKYVELSNKLKDNLIFNKDITVIENLIAEGADITGDPTLLSLVIYSEKPKAAIIKLLLDHGANPHATGNDHRTPLEFLNVARKNIPEYTQIKALLEEAMNKKQ